MSTNFEPDFELYLQAEGTEHQEVTSVHSPLGGSWGDWHGACLTACKQENPPASSRAKHVLYKVSRASKVEGFKRPKACMIPLGRRQVI